MYHAVLRQKTTNSDMQGADKTKTYVIYSENQMDINQLANEHINLGSTIHSDESTATIHSMLGLQPNE